MKDTLIITDIKYLETLVPYGSGTGVTVPDKFKIYYKHNSINKSKDIWIDTWYRPSSMFKEIFYTSIKDAFKNFKVVIDNSVYDKWLKIEREELGIIV